MRILTGIIISLLLSEMCAAQTVVRQKELFDFDWRFAYGHPYDPHQDFNTGAGYFSYLAKAGYGDGAAAASFDDRAWRLLDVPHDWAVELPFDAKGSHSHGYKAIGRQFPRSSVGWYRKTFTVDQTDLGKQLFLDFDGVARDSKVWVNGHYLGNEPSGYQSFSVNITDVLNYGGKNVVAVRADASMEEGWFYEGAGIYRHVWLRITNALHIPKDGTFVHCKVNEQQAEVTIEADIVNRALKSADFILRQKIIDASGLEVTSVKSQEMSLVSMDKGYQRLNLKVQNPHLWSLEDPYLYTIISEIISNDVIVDSYATTFGIRTILFDADKGFFLNGQHIKLKGTNNHQDHAGVGAALPDGLIEYRIQQLKSFGSNAYRSSHNPPTPELLNICDRLGMLVIDENRLIGTTDHALHELERLIRRDRNHPSVIVWSIGNEEWAIEGNEIGARMTLPMQNFAKKLDPTRPVNAAISGGWDNGIGKVIEVMGYNYLAHGSTDEHHAKFPSQASIGTEEGSTYATRGEYMDDDEKQYRSAYDRLPRPKWYDIEASWTHYAQRDYLSGMFIWTGFDYRGESTPYTWPSVTSYFGMLDLCGFPKDNVYYLKSWWQDEPVLHILPHWNWQGKEDKDIEVWVHSNCQEVELFLNDQSLGKQTMLRNGHLEWQVPYHEGILKAVGYNNELAVLTEKIRTTGPAKSIILSPHKESLKNDRQDVSVITVEVIDQQGFRVPTSMQQIQFEITGPARIIGLGNGDPTSHEKEKFIDEQAILMLPDVNILTLDHQTIQTWMQYKPALSKSDTTDNKVMRTSFSLSNIPAKDMTVTWFYQEVASVQAIFCNGFQLTNDQLENDKTKFVIEHRYLTKGENKIAIIGIPLAKKNEWDEPNKHPGCVQLKTPTGMWHRKLFNGKAQVIVQSTGGEGKVILKAYSRGLNRAELPLSSSHLIK